jgi:hypothetical protein
MREKYYRIGISGLIMLASQLPAPAQTKAEGTDTTRKVHVLQEIVISASRLQEKQLTAPVSISKLSTSQDSKHPRPVFLTPLAI